MFYACFDYIQVIVLHLFKLYKRADQSSTLKKNKEKPLGFLYNVICEKQKQRRNPMAYKKDAMDLTEILLENMGSADPMLHMLEWLSVTDSAYPHTV